MATRNSIQEVIGCLEKPIRDQIEPLLESSDLGYNPATKRLGRLFPDFLFDYIPIVTDKEKEGAEKQGTGGNS
jgi:hypothetical protein